MKNYEELIGKSMNLGDFLKICNWDGDIDDFCVPRCDKIEDGLRNGLVSVDIEKDTHTNIYFKYTNAVETYKDLVSNNKKDKLYVTITKIEFWDRNKVEK